MYAQLRSGVHLCTRNCAVEPTYVRLVLLDGQYRHSEPLDGSNTSAVREVVVDVCSSAPYSHLVSDLKGCRSWFQPQRRLGALKRKP